MGKERLLPKLTQSGFKYREMGGGGRREGVGWGGEAEREREKQRVRQVKEGGRAGGREGGREGGIGGSREVVERE